VVALEAHPTLADLLRRNVVINGRQDYVTTCHRAAWSDAGNLKFHLRRRYSANSSIGTVGPEQLGYLHDDEEVVEVEAVRLDDLLAPIPRIDVIKIDIEGAEVRALLGLEHTLRTNTDVRVMFEWSPSQVQALGDSPSALLDLLSSQGFGFHLMDETLIPVDGDDLIELPYANVVATR
jgi:FkbM family methyltransferase